MVQPSKGQAEEPRGTRPRRARGPTARGRRRHLAGRPRGDGWMWQSGSSQQGERGKATAMYRSTSDACVRPVAVGAFVGRRIMSCGARIDAPPSRVQSECDGDDGLARTYAGRQAGRRLGSACPKQPARDGGGVQRTSELPTSLMIIAYPCRVQSAVCCDCPVPLGWRTSTRCSGSARGHAHTHGFDGGESTPSTRTWSKHRGSSTPSALCTGSAVSVHRRARCPTRERAARVHRGYRPRLKLGHQRRPGVGGADAAASSSTSTFRHSTLPTTRILVPTPAQQ